jgi:MacB-like periplasmic core domain
MALEPGWAETAVPVRTAFVGAVAGVAGLVAALTFGLGLNRLVTEPTAFGWNWDVRVVTGAGDEQTGPEAREVAVERDVEGVADLVVRQLRVDGVALQGYRLEPLEGGGYTTVFEGRAPDGPDEVLVGTETLERNDHDVGDKIEVESLQGGKARSFTIVGRGVFPEFVHPAVPDSDTAAYNDFALFTAAGVRSLGPSREDFHEVLVRWTPGVDAPTARRTLAKIAPDIGEPQLPSNLGNLDRVNAFPAVIAAFLMLLAVLGVTHALATAVRRRAHEMALLKTLGFVGAQVRATIAWQATTLALLALTLGIPAGIIIGRWSWGLVAHNLGVATETPLPVLPILVAIPATLVLANALALLPARVAAHTSPASVLRTE